MRADDDELCKAGVFVDQNNQCAERGDCALIGVIDSSIDILHEAFFDESGNSRIIGIWHQAAKDGPTPHAIHGVFSQTYSRLYTGADIAELLSGAGAVEGIPRDTYESGHGTHVASIPAGKAVGTIGRGVAPQARVLVVAPHLQIAHILRKASAIRSAMSMP